MQPMQPNGRSEPLVNMKMMKHILVQSAYQLAWMMFFLYGLPKVRGDACVHVEK